MSGEHLKLVCPPELLVSPFRVYSAPTVNAAPQARISVMANQVPNTQFSSKSLWLHFKDLIFQLAYDTRLSLKLSCHADHHWTVFLQTSNWSLMLCFCLWAPPSSVFPALGRKKALVRSRSVHIRTFEWLPMFLREKGKVDTVVPKPHITCAPLLVGFDCLLFILCLAH